MIGLFFITSLSQRTFVPIELQELRGFVPSNNELKKTYSKFYDSYRDADNYFQHTKRVSESFKYDINGSTIYSLDTMLGYPIGPEIENSNGIGDHFTKILLYCCIDNVYQASLVSSDLTLVIWTIISFCILISIGKSLGWGRNLSSLLAVICNPAFYAYTYEGTLMSIIGSQLVFLSVLLAKNNKIYPYLLALIGSYLIFNSNDYHFFLYFPLTLFLFVPYFLKNLGIKKTIYIFIAIGIPFLMSINKFIWINDLLSSSLQGVDQEVPLINRSYHPLLLSSFIELPLINMIAGQIPYENFKEFIAFLFPTTAIKMGYVIGVLGLVSVKNMKNKYISIPIILLILYLAGPFHYILGLMSNTYQAETSIRINLLIYMIFAITALNIINNDGLFKYKNILRRASIIILIFSIMQFLIISAYDYVRGIDVIWFSALAHIASIVFFLLFLDKNLKKYIFLAILLLPLSNAFFFNGMRTFQSHDYTKLIEMNKNLSNQFKINDVAMLISSKNASHSIHASAFMQSKIRIIQAYIVPYPELFAKLYWQQYFSYDKKINQAKIDANIIEIAKYKDMTGPTLIDDKGLSLETENFMLLSGVNKIITTKETVLNPSKYSKVFTGYGISIFEPNNTPRWIYGSCRIINTVNSSELLSNKDLKTEINEKNSIFSQKNIGNKYCDLEPEISNIKINKKSSEIVFNILNSGVVFLNLSFNKNLHAYVNSNSSELEIFQCNIAYTCIKAENLKGLNQIRITYEKPSLKKYLANKI